MSVRDAVTFYYITAGLLRPPCHTFSQYCFCSSPRLLMRCLYVVPLRRFSFLTDLQDIQQRSTGGSTCGNVSAI